ncbi:MAG: adenylate/guanylate cyclase domain-containing protein [Nitrososphaerales archaeon]
MASGERRLAAIMFTDIVGFTRLSQANESLALELLEEHRSLLRPTFLAHGGVEVKTMGDSFLVEFRSALDAVLGAVETQRKMNERNQGVLPTRKLELRVGIHVGDVVHEAGDIYGDAVNIASRIEPLAEPGEVCISQQVFDQIRNKTKLEIEKIGKVELKNLEQPLAVYKVKLPRKARAKAEQPNHQQSGPRERLAVLPFVNISADSKDEYFADGLTEEMISRLSEIKDLKVIARTSVMGYKRKEKKVSEIARELEVGSVIEGSVRKSGNRIRVSVQLIDARTEEHLWSSNYDEEMTDIFAIQTDVASKVASALSAKFFSESPKKYTENTEAHALYLRGIHLSYEGGEDNLREAAKLLERAISMDPSFALAYVAYADVWGGLANRGYEDFASLSEKAEPAARKALVLDPGSAEAHAMMSQIHSLLDRFDLAIVEAEKAIQINPNIAEAHSSLVLLYGARRGVDEALLEAQKAYELDPLSSETGAMLARLAQWAGDQSLAIGVLTRMKELNPRNTHVLIDIASYYIRQGDFVKGQEMLETARQLRPNELHGRITQGVLFALTGKVEEAQRVLDEIRRNNNESASLAAQLEIETALGNIDEAYKALMRQTETHSWPFDIKWAPPYESLRRDARFPEFCRKVGIPT